MHFGYVIRIDIQRIRGQAATGRRCDRNIEFYDLLHVVIHSGNRYGIWIVIRIVLRDTRVPDDVDNVFHPVWHGVKKFEMWIFNHWGEQLFYSDDVNVGWNGKYGNNGTELGQDVYFWKAKGKFENGEIGLPMQNSDLVLPCGIFGRWEA